MINRGASIIPKSNNVDRNSENYDRLFNPDTADFIAIDNIMGEVGERGVRNLEIREYVCCYFLK